MANTVLQLAKKLNKEFNDENLALLADVVPQYKKLALGNLGVDYSLKGGFPYGRIIEIAGKFSSGKTTMACALIKAFQDENPDKMCVYFDIERSLDIKFQVEINGIDPNRLIYVGPSAMSAENVCQAIIDFQQSDDIGLIVMDSIPSLVVKEVAEAPMEKDLGMRASVAKLLHKFLPSMADQVASKGNIFCLINQVRESKAMNGATIYTLPGGSAPQYYSSVILRLGTRNWTLGDKVDLADSKSEGCDGFRIKFLVTKNKTADSRVSSGFLTYRYGTGIDFNFDNLEVALQYGFVERLNSTMYALKNLDTGDYYLDENGEMLKFRGKQAVRDFLRDNPDFNKEYVSMLLRHMTSETQDNKKIDLLDEESIKEIKEEIGVENEED